MTPDKYREFAALMESEGPGAPRDMSTEHPARFWDFFGRFADPGRQWAELSDDELMEINERFGTFLREQVRLRSH